MEPEKPFACSIPDCGMTFTNEDHLHVHTKKHDMALQLGMEQKAAFVGMSTRMWGCMYRNSSGFPLIVVVSRASWVRLGKKNSI